MTLLDKVCVGRASALPHDLLDECIARFDSDDVSCKWHALVQCILLISFALIAQLVEQLICNHQVVGSNPTEGTSFIP